MSHFPANELICVGPFIMLQIGGGWREKFVRDDRFYQEIEMISGRYVLTTLEFSEERRTKAQTNPTGSKVLLSTRYSKSGLNKPNVSISHVISRLQRFWPSFWRSLDGAHFLIANLA
jgi:hypothetical protein